MADPSLAPAWWSRDLSLGATGGDVAALQRVLGSEPNGRFDAVLEARVRGFQALRGLSVTGVVDVATAIELGGRPTEGLVPWWFGTPEQDLHVMLKLDGTDPDTIRRYQSSRRLPVTGVVDEITARELGD